MKKLEDVKKDRRLMLALTGITPEDFDELVPSFEENYEKFMIQLSEEKESKRKKGSGKKEKLETIEKKLFYTLLYLKVYPTYDVMSFIFDLDRAHCCKWVQRLVKVLEITLDTEIMLPKREIQNQKETSELFVNDIKIFIDGSERPMRRPKDPKEQKKILFWKKKRHGFKNLIISNINREIKVLTPTYEGTKHDFAICKEENLLKKIPNHLTVYMDTGFEGVEKEFPNVNVKKPKKKPRKKELTIEEKDSNRKISKVRVKVEHAIYGIKRFGVCSQIFRNIKKNLADIFILVCAGLFNYFLSRRELNHII